MVREWAGRGVTLLITVDTGAAAVAEIALARDLGMDVIVLDHHIFDERPPATALVNPRRDGRHLSQRRAVRRGRGLQVRPGPQACRIPPACPTTSWPASWTWWPWGWWPTRWPWWGRTGSWSRRGWRRFNDRANIRPGLAALLAVSGLDRGFPVTTGDFAYQLAPRINACGRIGRVMSALELLLTRDPDHGPRAWPRRPTAPTPAARNRTCCSRRRPSTWPCPTSSAATRAWCWPRRAWHKGIIGIGAARLVEQYQLPVILIAEEGGEARGSARSVPDVDVKCVLDRCSRSPGAPRRPRPGRRA